MESSALTFRIGPRCVAVIGLWAMAFSAFDLFAQTMATVDKAKTQISTPFAPGTGVSVFGSGFPKTASVLLKKEDSTVPADTHPLTAKVAPDGTGITFTLPPDLPTGRYTATIEDNEMNPHSLPIGTLLVQPKADQGVQASTLTGSIPSIAPRFRFPDAISPGERLSIDGAFTANAAGTIFLRPLGRDTAATAVNGSATETGKNFITTLPTSLAVDRYVATMDIAARQGLIIPGEVRIRSSGVKVTAVSPMTGYRNSETDGFDFDIIGEGFSRVPTLNTVEIEGHGEIPFITPGDSTSTPSRLLTANRLSADAVANGIACQGYPCLQVISDRKLRILGYKSIDGEGPIKGRVRVGDSFSDPPFAVTLGRVCKL